MQNDYLEMLRQRVDANPDSPLFMSLAEEYRRRGMLDDACAVMEKGVERQPALDVAHLVLARWYVARQMYDHARQSLLRLLERDPASVHGRKLLGQVYSHLGAYDDASEEYARAHALDPVDEEVREVLRSLGRSVEALTAGSSDRNPVDVTRAVGSSREQAGLHEVEELMSQGHPRRALALLNDIAASDTRTRDIILKRDELTAQVAATTRIQGEKIARLNTLMSSVRRHFSAS